MMQWLNSLRPLGAADSSSQRNFSTSDELVVNVAFATTHSGTVVNRAVCKGGEVITRLPGGWGSANQNRKLGL